MYLVLQRKLRQSCQIQNTEKKKKNRHAGIPLLIKINEKDKNELVCISPQS